MLYNIVYSEKYHKLALRFFKKHPQLFSQYGKTIEMLELNPFHPSLRLHALKGQMKGFHSVSINISYRITLEFFIEGKQIIPLDIGTHDSVYE